MAHLIEVSQEVLKGLEQLEIPYTLKENPLNRSIEVSQEVLKGLEQLEIPYTLKENPLQVTKERILRKELVVRLIANSDWVDYHCNGEPSDRI